MICHKMFKPYQPYFTAGINLFKSLKLSLVLTNLVFSVLIITFMIGCGKSEPSFREYTEITSGGGRFGQQSGQQIGQVSSQEIELFNKITYNANLADGVSWQTPSQWKEVKETGVRIVSFKTANNLDVTLIAFPGNVGGVSANLSRWVGQVEANLDESELQEMIRSLVTAKNKNGLPYVFVDFEGQPKITEQNKPNSILAAIFGFNDQMLFVKVLGEKGAVAADRKAFEYLVDNIAIGKKS